MGSRWAGKEKVKENRSSRMEQGKPTKSWLLNRIIVERGVKSLYFNLSSLSQSVLVVNPWMPRLRGIVGPSFPVVASACLRITSIRDLLDLLFSPEHHPDPYFIGNQNELKYKGNKPLTLIARCPSHGNRHMNWCKAAWRSARMCIYYSTSCTYVCFRSIVDLGGF